MVCARTVHSYLSAAAVPGKVSFVSTSGTQGTGPYSRANGTVKEPARTIRLAGVKIPVLVLGDALVNETLMVLKRLEFFFSPAMRYDRCSEPASAVTRAHLRSTADSCGSSQFAQHLLPATTRCYSLLQKASTLP